MLDIFLSFICFVLRCVFLDLLLIFDLDYLGEKVAVGLLEFTVYSGISLLLDVEFTNIIDHSVGCFFTLLILPFVV